MKNLKGFLANSIAIIVGTLIFIFMSQPHMNYVVESILGNGSTQGITGYEIIGNYFDSEDGKAIMLALCCLLVTILAGMLILFGIFNLLTSTGVIKVKNEKIMNTVNSIVSVLMIVFGLIGICCAAGISKDASFNAMIGNISFANGTYAISWALIVNFVLSFVALVATIIAGLGTKKSKKKKK